MLELYRAALAIRRAEPGLGDGTLAWRQAPAGVLDFDRDPGIRCVANLSAAPVDLPAARGDPAGQRAADGRGPAAARHHRLAAPLGARPEPGLARAPAAWPGSPLAFW